jgi:hypothetical protein
MIVLFSGNYNCFSGNYNLVSGNYNSYPTNYRSSFSNSLRLYTFSIVLKGATARRDGVPPGNYAATF